MINNIIKLFKLLQEETGVCQWPVVKNAAFFANYLYQGLLIQNEKSSRKSIQFLLLISLFLLKIQKHRVLCYKSNKMWWRFSCGGKKITKIVLGSSAQIIIIEKWKCKKMSDISECNVSRQIKPDLLVTW